MDTADTAKSEFVLIGKDPNRSLRWEIWKQTADADIIVYGDLCSVRAVGDIHCTRNYDAYPSASLEFTNLTDTRMKISCSLLGILSFPGSKKLEWNEGFRDEVDITVELDPHETQMVDTEIAAMDLTSIGSFGGLKLVVRPTDMKISRMMQVFSLKK